MQYRTATFYKEFRCIGGICEDSCCENWEIDLDDASLKNYMKQKGDFGKRLKNSTRVKDKQFILNGTRCPFLNDENLCDIFIEMGEECLCETCTNFPRHIEEFDNLKEVSLTMSCPEASRIMLAKKEKMTFECKEGTDAEYGLKHIEPVKSLAFWKKSHVNTLDQELFDVLYEARECMFDILQNRQLAIAKRAAIILMMGFEIQEFIDQHDYAGISAKVKEYQTNEKMQELEHCFSEHGNRVKEKEEWMKQILNMFDGLETIKEEWTELLKSGERIMHTEVEYQDVYPEFTEYYKEKEYEFEHILVYYIFNYFLGASYDQDAFTKVKFAVISYLVILELDIAYWIRKNREFVYEDQVLVAHAYSKEVEHSYNNFESLQLVLSAHPILNIDNILIALLS